MRKATSSECTYVARLRHSSDSWKAWKWNKYVAQITRTEGGDRHNQAMKLVRENYDKWLVELRDSGFATDSYGVLMKIE